MDLLASYTTAREELDGLLERWEALFEESQRESGEDDTLATSHTR